MERRRKLMAVSIAVLSIIAASIAGPLIYWIFRAPTDLHVADFLQMQTMTAVRPDAHHSNTDLFKYNEKYLLVHASSPYHFASRKCRLVVRTSTDGERWEKVAEIGVPGEDVRDPKFALINGKLFLYFLNNVSFDPEPYSTSFCMSENGIHWTGPQRIKNEGWLFWRPHTPDGKVWYVPAYWCEHGKAALFKSTDGIDWVEVGPIYNTDHIDETDISFKPDGTLMMTGRLEMDPTYWGYHPEGHTLIGVSEPPYTDWTLHHSYETRLDGPCLFQIGERTYAVGRRQVGGSSHMGSCWGRKRTSLYLVLPDSLVFLSDLPSCGDTAYAGVVVDEDSILISYYTSPPGRDYFWLMGMLSNSSIETARIRLDLLESLVEQKLAAQPDAKSS
jgi:hypothetical protein